MNSLRNFFSTRALTYLRQNGQNALFNFTQQPGDNINEPPTVDVKGKTTTAASINANKPIAQPLLIPRSILDATKLVDKKLIPRNGAPTTTTRSISPTTLKRFRRIERKMELVYRCKLCNTRNEKLITEAAYKSGIVILQCDGCNVNHLIIDNLGWFAETNKGKSFDEMLAEKGDRVKVIKVNEHGDLI